MWVWLNAINKLKSYLHSGSADMCVRSHVIALALSLGVPGKPCQLLTDNNGTRITVLKIVTGGHGKGVGTEIGVDLISTKLWKAEDD